MEEYNPTEFASFRDQIEKRGGTVVGPVALSDAVTPDGTPNTSCRQHWEAQLATDHVVKVLTPIAQGIIRAQYYLVFTPTDRSANYGK